MFNSHEQLHSKGHYRRLQHRECSPEGPAPADGVETSSFTPISTKGWSLFLGSCLLSCVFSAINLLSLTSAQVRIAIPGPLGTPTVYMGLETLRDHDRRLCRSRVTFPRMFSIFRGQDIHRREHIHAPDDKTVLNFGEEISAYVEFYVPDYGLENCTLSVKRGASSNVRAGERADESIEIWLLEREGSLSNKTFLDNLHFSYGFESFTPPFFCPSRSHLFFQWRCPTTGCNVHIPLEGVTALTAAVGSKEQTGFRLNQFEAMSCI
ncbi:hypothetical protein OBBRIDRAFT_733748 [Obba rivulosa]|uniref:Uncharacterized protein n=1 Tax=Obba rivulosa TaxID=1052685 RepID=A0A8E2AVC6_9APHY|nr:hypothetical protein OBBRIDRAFT_733748 [Obba rivulosa]